MEVKVIKGHLSLFNSKAGRTPLSYAISNNCDTSIIKALVDRAPESINICNNVCHVLSFCIMPTSRL